MRFPFAFGSAHAREAETPPSSVKLLIADRETKNAVSGLASVFIGVLLLSHSASPAPQAGEAKKVRISRDSAIAQTIKPALAPAPSIVPAAWITVRPPGPLASLVTPAQAAPFLYKGSGSDRDRALDCLAAAAWYEAGNDPEGQKSVIQVVLNRLRHPSFPKTVCGVVFQGSERVTGCQFTFTCDGSMRKRVPSPWAWKRARDLSEKALDGAVDVTVGQATHYHADYVSPWWSSALQRVNQIGAHIFYRWPGVRGKLGGVRNFGTEANAFETARERGKPSSASSAPGAPGLLPTAGDQAVQTALGPAISPNVSKAHLIAIDPQAPNGRWAVAALAQCGGEPSCSVMGYSAGAELARNTNLEPGQMERPLFLFVRDPASGMELALWDCTRAQRAQTSQCLPSDSKALAQLMRNR